MTAAVPQRRVPVVVTGLGVLSALGRGPEPLLAAAAAGDAAFGAVGRFDVAARRTRRAAHLPGPAPRLAEALLDAIGDALGQSDSGTPPGGLLLALHSDTLTGAVVQEVTARARDRHGIDGTVRTYTGACVASSSALADAAAAIAFGRAERLVVAAGYLVEPDTFAVFDAGGALSRDGEVRPFSRDRRGLLLGDGVAAAVLESADSAHLRGATPLATLAGWGRSGDGHHVSRPDPEGTGLARAVTAALTRAGLRPDDIGYVNANAPGSVLGDVSEARALRTVFGDRLADLPVSSTKSVHGHALEASALLEFVLTVHALRSGRLPVNAGYLAPDAECPLNLVLTPTTVHPPSHALTLNAAFGGANTALLIGAA
ncbi:beta-ketoacyl-[acyl-carrier-protein] synthase family protein [Actinacidiphila acididurans]|uniref:Nodulation protein E n=1 Tax=Actinacidiphila acididurans TaxID=2784346 RepID=A0ABS2U2K3_9ACTN|nr:beta-ketoacyl synthase N-terminal-like domain-containing protein [Actinacidiphila acididurans]MBM9509839.1 beta-ketoacyl-[acyl-carrier-protein] synthase family protein [Actinacidiphila acididurans]